MDHAARIIKQIGLRPLVETNGFVVRSVDFATAHSTAETAAPVYVLMAAGEFSSLHRLRTDEVYHFYAGDPTEVVQISADGRLTKMILGPHASHGHAAQVTVTGGSWQGTR